MSMDEMIEVLARYRYNAKHDADRIKALESELSRLRASSFVTAVPAENYEKMNADNDRLKAEVERLTKAGDDLHAFLINYIVEGRISSAYLNKLDDGWNSAKEGKRS